MRELSFAQAVNEAIEVAMSTDPSVICYGLGVPDPKGVFGTTLGLQEKFGSDRVFDMPTSENAMTGVAIGAALHGLRPIMVHQRLDFFLLAMDQLVNNAAKWFYMFERPVPITIRLVVGHGWGQGPTHSQNLHAWFAHIPGLKVVIPTSPRDAKGLLLTSIFDDNPVLFIEHRWLHSQIGFVEPGHFTIPLGKAKILRAGTDITVVGISYMTIEARRAVDRLRAWGIECELIDLCALQPIDWDTLRTSVRKTGRLLALDTAQETCSVASEIVARISQDCFAALKDAPARLGQPDFPSPTSFALTRNYYRGSEDIVAKILRMMGKDAAADGNADRAGEGDRDAGSDGDRDGYATAAREPTSVLPHDVPGDWFKGPF